MPRRSWLLCLALIATLLPASLPCQAEERARDLEPRIISVVEESTPRTVCIRAHLVDRFAVLGSGSIISADGYILTCAHVVEALPAIGGQRLNVMLTDGRSFDAELLGSHAKRDFAVLKIEAEDLPYYELGDSGALEKGTWVVALGHPMGIIGSEATGNDVPAVTAGVVTGIGRKMMANSGGFDFKLYPDAIETDLPLFFGNSGGPLVDMEGKLVGVNAAIRMGGEPRSFSVPMATVKGFLAMLERGENALDGDEPTGFLDRLTKFVEYAQEVGEQAQELEVDPRLDRLKEEFVQAAETVSPSVVSVRLGGERVAFGVVVDEDGVVAVPHHTLTRKGFGAFLVGKVRDGLPEDSGLRQLLDPLLPKQKRGKITVETADGGVYTAKIRKSAEGIDVAFLDVHYGDDEVPPAIELADEEAPVRGSWVISVTGEQAPAGVGILSTAGKRIDAVTPVPLTLNDLLDMAKQDMGLFDARNFPNVLFHDAFVSNKGVGGPLLDGQGHWLGLNLFTLSRGAGYAVPAADVLKALRN